MQQETITTLKDILIPALSIIVAGGSVYLSHRQMRLQIKKNMRVQHIDRIRDETAEFLNFLFLAKANTEEVDIQIGTRSYSRILLLANTRKEKQKELLLVISNCLMSFSNQDIKTIDISESVSLIYDSAQAAIKELEDEI